MKGAAAEPYEEFDKAETTVLMLIQTSHRFIQTIKLNYGVDYQNGGTCPFDPIPDTWTKMLDIMLFWAGKNMTVSVAIWQESIP